LVISNQGASGKDLIPGELVLVSEMDIKIRRAGLPDAPAIAEFNLRLAEESEGLRLDPASVKAGVAALLRDPAKGVYYIAEVNGAVAGQTMITREWSDWRNGNFWWVQSVFVKPEFRGQGVFRRLFAHVKTLAQAQKDVPALRLYVHADNSRAHRSYENLGMKRTPYEVFELDLAEHGGGAG
jgi:GNAT superfamily N-acetyltransferase